MIMMLIDSKVVIIGTDMPESQIRIVVGIPHPKVPVFSWLIEIPSALGGEKFTLV
jgi:hypothetical protein